MGPRGGKCGSCKCFRMWCDLLWIGAEQPLSCSRSSGYLQEQKIFLIKTSLCWVGWCRAFVQCRIWKLTWFTEFSTMKKNKIQKYSRVAIPIELQNNFDLPLMMIPHITGNRKRFWSNSSFRFELWWYDYRNTWSDNAWVMQHNK
jgi:hypothetical protein